MEKAVDSCVQDPGRIRGLAASIRAGELAPTELLQRCLDRVAVVQPVAEPWRTVDAERAMAVAAERERQAARGEFLGPLHGIPVGVKDIIDLAGLQSRCNCKALEEVAPASADAEIVLALKTAGAVVLGKAHTTEFAFFHPSPARNPHNRAHTPGGSSSGSAAAVASGTAPLALGTQTLASVNRPAAYCGIAAYKPSTRLLSTFGVAPLAPSYDTVGFYGWSVEDAVFAFEAVAPAFLGPPEETGEASPPTIAVLADPLIEDMDDGMRAAFETLARDCESGGYRVERRAAPVSFAHIDALHWSTMHYELGRIHRGLLDYEEGLVSDRFCRAIEEGLSLLETQYLEERAELDRLRSGFLAAMADVDAFLWPAAPGPAPEGLASTGDPKYIAPWTTLGGPIVTIPAGKTAAGLPLGCILAGKPGADRKICALAREVASRSTLARDSG